MVNGRDRWLSGSPTRRGAFRRLRASSRHLGGGRSDRPSAGPVVLAVVLALALTLLGFTREGWAQEDAESALRRLGTENARLYLHPVTAGLGAALNSGFFHTASVHAPLGFDVGVRAMGALVPSNAERFRPELPGSVEYGGQVYDRPYTVPEGATTPTAVGGGSGVVAVPAGAFRQALLDAGEDPSDYELPFPAGLDLPAVPFSLLQVGVGLPAGTEVAVRFTPSIRLGDEVGTVAMVGGAVKHSLDQWMELPSPLRLAVSAGLQKLSVGDYLDMSARQLSLVAGFRAGAVSPYVAAGLESAAAEVDYRLENRSGNPALPEEGTRVAFRDEADNSVRGVVGLTLHLGPVMLNGEYAHAEVPVASAKLLFGWR